MSAAFARDPSLPDLTGRVALVTGASGLLGGGIAGRFAAAGAGVVVHFRSDEKSAQALVGRIVGAGGHALSVQADLTREAECARLVERGAARVRLWPAGDGEESCIVMQDVEGNESAWTEDGLNATANTVSGTPRDLKRSSTRQAPAREPYS